MLHTAKEQFKEAIEYFTRFKQISADDPDVLCQLGYCLLMEGRVGEAIDNRQAGPRPGGQAARLGLAFRAWLRQVQLARDLDERLLRLLSGEGGALGVESV